jgi:TolB protein
MALSQDYTCYGIVVIDADGSDEKRLTAGCDQFVEPWSPDGTKIVYNVGDFPDPDDIGVINPDGSGDRNLTNTPDLNEAGVDWKPNGKKMTYHRNGDIWKMNPDGTHKDRLTFSPAYEDQPIWSPRRAQDHLLQVRYRGRGGSDDERRRHEQD